MPLVERLQRILKWRASRHPLGLFVGHILRDGPIDVDQIIFDSLGQLRRRGQPLFIEGRLRVAQPEGEGVWSVNEWVKQAVLLNFPIQSMTTVEVGPFEFHDKMPLKKGYAAAGVRVVPHAVVRYGAHVAKDCILMPSYVNLGAYVGERTMVDTWATVGSCAQIGADVHLSGGVGIGGVLEPLQAAPVIVEDGAFIGSRCIVVEGGSSPASTYCLDSEWSTFSRASRGQAEDESGR